MKLKRRMEETVQAGRGPGQDKLDAGSSQIRINTAEKSIRANKIKETWTTAPGKNEPNMGAKRKPPGRCRPWGAESSPHQGRGQHLPHLSPTPHLPGTCSRGAPQTQSEVVRIQKQKTHRASQGKPTTRWGIKVNIFIPSV